LVSAAYGVFAYYHSPGDARGFSPGQPILSAIAPRRELQIDCRYCHNS